MTTDTTSAGMPSLTPAHDALDIPPVQAVAAVPAKAIQSLVGEGKTQVSSTLVGVAAAVREIASQLETNGAAPLAKYVLQAADTVSSWSDTVERKSVDELIDDTRTLVRTSPALAVGLAVAGGFVMSRLVRAR